MEENFEKFFSKEKNPKFTKITWQNDYDLLDFRLLINLRFAW